MKKLFAIILISAVVLFAGVAKWNVEGYDKDFNIIGYKQIVFDYSNQLNITLGELPGKVKLISASKLGFVYTGNDSIRDNYVYYRIEPWIVKKFSAKPDTIVYIRIDKTLWLTE